MSSRSPTASTGPVGCPVGEPPGGSRLIAIWAAVVISARIWSEVTGTRVETPAGITPSETGASLPVTALVDQFYKDVQRMGGGRWDTSSLIRRLRAFG